MVLDCSNPTSCQAYAGTPRFMTRQLVPSAGDGSVPGEPVAPTKLSSSGLVRNTPPFPAASQFVPTSGAAVLAPSAMSLFSKEKSGMTIGAALAIPPTAIAPAQTTSRQFLKVL